MKRHTKSRSEFRNRIEKHWRLVDNHAVVLYSEAKANQNRIQNLERIWKAKSRAGFLPHEKSAGILEYVKKNSEDFRTELAEMFSERLLSDPEIHQRPIRGFDEILYLTDKLEDIHRDLALCERVYWQRLEKFEIEGMSPMGNSAVAEYGDIQKIYNAADYVCLSYYRNLIGKQGSWTGIVVFGQEHEFRSRGPFILAPNYVKTSNLRMWNYFSHEVAHQIIGKIRSKNDFSPIYGELEQIVSSEPHLSRHALPSYLAEEVIAEILSTLVSGEEYPMTLAELKYYPTLRHDENGESPDARYLFRPIRCPMILRALISCWTIRIAWGFAGKDPFDHRKREDQVFIEILKRIKKEDAIEMRQLRDAASAVKAEPKQGSTENTSSQRFPRLKDGLKHLSAVNKECLSVMASILKRDIIPRLKLHVKNDFYGTTPTETYFNPKSSVDLRIRDLYEPSNALLLRTKDVDSIEEDRHKKLGEIERIRNNLIDCVVEPAEPRDVIAVLSKICREGRIVGILPNSQFDHVALLTIALSSAARKERFPDLYSAR